MMVEPTPTMNIKQPQGLSSEHFCTQCNRSFTRVRDRIRHENSVHIRKERFQCSHCEKTFTRRDSKVRHAYQCLKSLMSNENTSSIPHNNYNNMNNNDTMMIVEQPQPQQSTLPLLPPLPRSTFIDNPQEPITLPPILNKERFRDTDPEELTSSIMGSSSSSSSSQQQQHHHCNMNNNNNNNSNSSSSNHNKTNIAATCSSAIYSKLDS